MPYLVRDWWPEGKAYVTWVADQLRTAYDEYSGSAPADANDLQGSLTIVREISGGSTSTGTGSAVSESSIWDVPDDSPGDIVVQFGIDGHTGAWGLAVSGDGAMPDPVNDIGALLPDGDDLYVGVLDGVSSGILTLSMLEVFPSRRGFPDSYWELSGDDIYLTGATE